MTTPTYAYTRIDYYPEIEQNLPICKFYDIHDDFITLLKRHDVLMHKLFKHGYDINTGCGLHHSIANTKKDITNACISYNKHIENDLRCAVVTSVLYFTAWSLY